MNSQDKRLDELKKKDTLTDAEMQELIKLSPSGTFKSGPNVKKLGVVDIEKAFQNFEEGPDRAMHAMKNGCYMEVISLRLQHAEFWLRMFWVVKNSSGKIFDPNDRRMFGGIIEDCAKLGFRQDLVARLKKFNRDRINAIHKYLLGATDYGELQKVCDDSTGLDGEVGEYVRREVGLPIA